ncbi:MAG: CheR family methyltransferase [Candidatus Aminicenantales bacterium]
MSMHLRTILDHVHRTTGFDARVYRSSTLKRRLARRLSATGASDYAAYLDVLRQDPEERIRLIESLSIDVSEFFRDKRVFLYLRDTVLPLLFDRAAEKRRKTIRVWSVGCSKGQEPYSMAILFREALEKEERNRAFKIIIQASDFSSAALQHARAAVYQKNQLTNVPRRLLSTYFERAKKNTFRLKEEIKQMVTFRHHDVIHGDLPGMFDLILCRNVFIFFEPEAQKRLSEKIHRSLRKGGILVLGTSETPRQEDLFTCLSSKNHVYRKLA